MVDKARNLVEYAFATNYEGVQFYLRDYGLLQSPNPIEAVLESFAVYGDQAITDFFHHHPDKEMIVELFGEKIVADKPHSRKRKEYRKGVLTITFSIKECMLALVALMLFLFFISKN